MSSTGRPKHPMAAKIITVVGPTASGKTRRGVAIARHFDGEIVSADSRQVYTGMDIGTGKDIADYGNIPHHLIDIAPAGYKYNLFQYLRDARAAIADIEARGRRPIIVGGTGMYVESLLKGIAMPEVPANEKLRKELSELSLAELTDILSQFKSLHNTTDVDTPQRAIRAIEIERYYIEHPYEAVMVRNPVPVDSIIIGIDIPRDERRRLISERLRRRFEQEDMLAEVKKLLASGIPAENLIYYGLEYKFITLHAIGRISAKEMFDSLEIAIHQFAKRQMTWFRGMERRGFTIHWLPWDMPDTEFLQAVENLCI